MTSRDPSRAKPSPLGYALLLSLVPLSALLVGLVASQRADPDLWGRLSVGAVLFRAGSLPIVDDFSYTASATRWIDHEWGSGVVFYAVLAAAGEPGLLILKYAAAAAALWLVFAAHRGVGAPPGLSAVVLLLLVPGLLSGYVSTLRAQVFSFAFFLLGLLVLERVRLSRWRPAALLALVPLCALWGNLHGGFVMGVLAIGLYGVAEAALARPRAAALHLGLALACLGTVGLANPYGRDYLAFLVHAWTLDRTGVMEWLPLLSGPWSAGQLYLSGLTLLAAVLASLAAARALRRRSEADALAPALVLLLLVAMTLRARRIHTFLVLTLAFYLPVLLPQLRTLRLPSLRRGARALPWAAALAACAAAAAALAFGLPRRPVLHTFVAGEYSRGVPAHHRYPVGAVRYLRESPHGGRLLNPFTPGQFLYWTLYPRFRVAIDGRYEEVYRREQFRAVQAFYSRALAQRPSALLALAEHSRADFVLFRSRDPGLDVLTGSRAWKLAYDDGTWALAARRKRLGRDAPTRTAQPVRRWPTIGSFFSEADRARFASYPRSEAQRATPGVR